MLHVGQSNLPSRSHLQHNFSSTFNFELGDIFLLHLIFSFRLLIGTEHLSVNADVCSGNCVVPPIFGIIFNHVGFCDHIAQIIIS